MKQFKTAALLLLGVLGGLAVAQHPEINSSIRRAGAKIGRWLNSGPAAELEASKDQLEQSLKNFAEMRPRIVAQVEAVGRKAEAREQELLQVEMLLARFKEEYGAGLKSGFPRNIFHRVYSEDQIRQQVQKLLERRAELQPIDNGVRTRLTEALAQIDSRLAATRQHLENMPVYGALAEAGHGVGQSELALSGLKQCLDQNQAFFTTSPVRAADDLVREMQQANRSSVPVDEFLKDAAAVTPPTIVDEAPSITDLTAELKRFVEEHKSLQQ